MRDLVLTPQPTKGEPYNYVSTDLNRVCVLGMVVAVTPYHTGGSSRRSSSEQLSEAPIQDFSCKTPGCC